MTSCPPENAWSHSRRLNWGSPIVKKKVVVHRGGAIKKGRLINVTRCPVAGSDVSVAKAANLHRATLIIMLPGEG